MNRLIKNLNRMRLRPIWFCSVIAGLTLSGIADQLILTGGRTLDGIIQSQSSQHVTLRVNSGTMTIPRSQIEQIKSSDTTHNEQLKTTWEAKRSEALAYANSPYAKLSEQLRQLTLQRQSALDAQRYLNNYKQIEKRQEQQKDQLTKESAQLAGKLRTLSEEFDSIEPPKGDLKNNARIRAYNEAIHKKSALQTQQTLLVTEFETKRKKLETDEKNLVRSKNTAQQTLSNYYAALEALSSQVTAVAKTSQKNPDSPEDAALFQHINQTLSKFRQEISSTVITPTQRGNCKTVYALINGRRLGEFLLDTGASSVVLNESFAKELGIDISSLPESEVLVVGGGLVDAKRITLQSIAVGDAIAHDVPAVIIKEHPNNIEDGLLGMTFLRNFNVNLNGKDGNIELRSIAP